MIRAVHLVDVPFVIPAHSNYSDGTATVDELPAAAARGGGRRASADRSRLGAGSPRRVARVAFDFVLVATEVSQKHGHHLAFGVNEEISHAGRSALEIAEAVRHAGGIGTRHSRGCRRNAEVPVSRTFANGETRTRTGDTTIFSRGRDSLEQRRNPCKRAGSGARSSSMRWFANCVRFASVWALGGALVPIQTPER